MLWAIRITVAVIVALLAIVLLLYLISHLFNIQFMGLLKVLALPITAGAAVPLLTWLQKKRELEVEHQRAQDKALQAYLDQMGNLLRDKEFRLRTWSGVTEQYEDDEVRAHAFARALTMTVLGLLDGNRKRSVLQFLHESQLTNVLDLSGADLSGADLSWLYLSFANLRGVNLSGADLSGAYLRKTKLSGADLSGAYLRKAYLKKADLSTVVDEDSVIRDLDTTTALRNADLSGAKLYKTLLFGADLTGAKGVTAEELSRQTNYLEGATMPNGQKYEDWLKSTGRAEEGKNEGSS